ncbi:reverse transcriptase domain-containing protein [Tanacetum coccineum]
MDGGSGSCIQTNEGTYSKVTYAYRSGRTRETYCLPGSIQRSGERRTNDGKESQADANLLCKPGAKEPENKLHRHRKISTGIGACKQKAKKILSSSHIKPRVSVKGQVFADFIVERREEVQDDSAREEEPLLARWTLFTDGSSCVDGCGAGVILTDPDGVEFTYALRFQFEATNNEAEYEALIAGLRIAEIMGVKNLEVNVDSKLVINQVNGTYIAKETDMIKYLEKVKALTNTFRAFLIKQVPRSKNKKADALSKMAFTSFAHLSKQVLVEELKEKSVNEREVLAVVGEEGDTWMTPIHEYLTDETLPAERNKARAIKRKSQRFAIINGILYKKSFLGPWLRCAGPSQANYVLREIHEGSCSMHAGARSVIAKALRTGYYWPTMQKFGLPGEIISDNGKQFRDKPIQDGCEKLGKENKNWLEEISHVLWAHRTMIKSSNGDTPFSLTYGTEAVIPAEIGMPTFRIAEVDVAKNDEALEINLDLIEEKREQAAIREAKSKRQMEKYYNTKVRNTSFKPGDLVYRSNEASRVEDTGKLGPKWEGPYEVTEALGKGSYKLKDCNGKEIPRTWNVCNLKKCYIYKV